MGSGSGSARPGRVLMYNTRSRSIQTSSTFGPASTIRREMSRQDGHPLTLIEDANET